MKRVKFKEVKSLRMKLTLYGVLSMIATILIMIALFAVFRLRWPILSFDNAVILSVFALMIFTVLFLLISYDTIFYLKEIILTMERMKNGDMDARIPVEGGDELAVIADSVNEMRERMLLEYETKKMSEKARDELITNVAHDLRTPLTSVIGYLDLVKREDLLTPEQQRKYINIVYDKAKSLEHLIEDLFDYTRYEKDKFQIYPEEFDLNQFMRQIVDEFYPSLSECELTCVEEYWPAELMVCCDGELLARAIGNLINNAIKYGEDGKRIEIYTEKRGKNAVVRVVNYGRMIPKEDLERVFDKFFRVEGSRSLKTGGTGLGLPIAKNIVELHGGSITADSGLLGTVFQVELPLCSE